MPEVTACWRYSALLSCALLASAGWLAASRSVAYAGSSDSHPTKVIVFEPYAGEHLKPEMTVARRATGDCWSTSLATVRPDAWRCSTGNTIYDPCFSAKSGAKQVACPIDALHRKIMVLTLTKPLPASQVDPIVKQLRPPDTEPWFLRLTDGTDCWFVVGATFTIGEHRANYECGDDRWIIGYTREKKPGWWVARLVKGPGATVAHEVPVAIGVL